MPGVAPTNHLAGVLAVARRDGDVPPRLPEARAGELQRRDVGQDFRRRCAHREALAPSQAAMPWQSGSPVARAHDGAAFVARLCSTPGTLVEAPSMSFLFSLGRICANEVERASGADHESAATRAVVRRAVERPAQPSSRMPIRCNGS